MSTDPTPAQAAARRLVKKAGPLPDHVIQSLARQLKASTPQVDVAPKRPA